MTFDECFERFVDISEKINLDDIDTAYIQINIIGKDSGCFYLHIDKNKMEVCRGEYKDRNVQWIFTLPAFARILDGIMDPIYAYTTGKFKMMGDINLGRTLLTRISRLT